MTRNKMGAYFNSKIDFFYATKYKFWTQISNLRVSNKAFEQKKNRLTVIRYTLKNKLIKSNRKETHK